MKTQIFHHAKTESSKNPLKETKILQDIITLKLISSFNTRSHIYKVRATLGTIP
jgi:hypothetical protein